MNARTIAIFRHVVAGLALAAPLCAAAQSQAVSTNAAAAASSPAPAASGTQALETVIVRGRGRTETQQSVPISIKSFSAKAIEDAGIKKPGDFVALTPNLSLAESQSVGTSFMTIRGLSQVRNGEAPMAVVVDGVIQSDAKQFTQELFDIQSIEVLRGPQGALYGRNATGGAILITTKQPTNVLGGYGELVYGTGSEKVASGAISGPIVNDTLFFRLAGSVTDRKGYFENDYLHEKADLYRDQTVRALLKWNATDRLTFDLRANYVHDHAGGDNFQYQPTHLQADCTADPANAFDFSRLNANAVSRTFCANNFGLNQRDLSEITLKADYDFGFATLSAVGSHNRVREYLQGDQFPYTASKDLFGTPDDNGHVVSAGLDGTQTQFVNVGANSIDLRLTSPSGPGLRWMAGVYGLKTERFISTTTGSDFGLGIDEVTYDPKFASPTNPTASWFADKDHNKATAAFANIEYDITSRIEGAIAARYDRDEREQVIDPRQTIGLPPGCTATDGAACTKEATYSAFQPKVSLRYKADDGSLFYASAGKGFRSGQFNQSGVGAAAAAATPPVNGVTDQIGAEITKSYELGYKTLLMDGRVQINSSIFKTDVTNAPYFVFIGAVGAQVLVPVDSVRLYGGEFEAVANVARGLDVNLGVGVTDSKITKYAVDSADVGNWAPYVPKFTANAGAQYRFPVTAGLRVALRSDLIVKGKQYWDPENSTARSTVTLVNVRAALEDAGGIWTAAVSVNNVADKRYNAEWVSGGFVQPAVPRIVRFDVRYNF